MALYEPLDSVFWYRPRHEMRQLHGTVTADVVIVGGGIAGLSAAQAFLEKGCSVVVLEKYFCGSGASGKSSGFITPDSEFSLGSLVERYGPETARLLWEFVRSGVQHIKTTIEQYDLECDYQVQDTLIVASSARDYQKILLPEYKARISLDYATDLYPDLTKVLTAQDYYGGISYGETFGINGYQYLQGLKRHLEQRGVRIYEETPALSCKKERVVTRYGAVHADFIITCMDRFTPDLDLLSSEVYHVQTFLMVSDYLTDYQRKMIFPERPFMIWDTELLYTYYRITGDNRLLLGGSKLTQTYAQKAYHDNEGMYKKLTNYWASHFPQVTPIFRYMWPGLIGVSKDIMPLAGQDVQNSSLYYIAGAAGLPWAAALGKYAADSLIDGRSELNVFFDPARSFTIGPRLQKLIGTRLSFALSHLISLKSF